DLVALEGDDLEFIHTHFRTITDDGWAGGEIANWNNMVSTPILWNPEDSLMNAIDFFVDNGVNIPEDYELFRIRWISNDHLTFVCNGTDLNTYQYKSCILKIPGPHAVSSFKVEVEDFNNVNLSWNFDENTPDALSIVIFRDGAEIVQLLPSNTEYMDEDVEEGNHQYEIYVTYTGYENSVSRFAEADVILSNPTELSYNFGDVYNVLDLNWIAPQLLRSLTGYQIYRDDELLEEISIQTTFEDTDVPNGIHTYKVRAVFGAGNFSDFSNELEIWIANEAPLNFDGVLQGEHSVNLSWESPNPDNPNITGYNLYRNEELIAELDAESTSYLDENLEDDEYNYYVTAIYYDLFESEASDIFNITITGSSNNTLILAVTELVGNYPNPFNPITTINYSLADEGDVELTVYNIKGQKVSILVNEIKDSGHYQAVWDGTDNNKKQVASGVYFYRLSTGEKTINKKMLLLK
ncbi:MAG: T9SS type A sorting domain-containing protein, partial [Candidatus Heimdallarchaeota archaeon]|nr:T9SS type A sorting domain-containing protein [Candidatus Heimdallarchaeota archaeon]